METLGQAIVMAPAAANRLRVQCTKAKGTEFVGFLALYVAWGNQIATKLTISRFDRRDTSVP
jgi:hypothetical protein